MCRVNNSSVGSQDISVAIWQKLVLSMISFKNEADAVVITWNRYPGGDIFIST
jgi:hypothetical protein